jgi:hypothetical protein
VSIRAREEEVWGMALVRDVKDDWPFLSAKLAVAIVIPGPRIGVHGGG